VNWPRITIVTPSFNQGQFLEQTIRSVLDQNYPNLDYIVMDGGSTDSSVDIIKKYATKLSYWVSEKDNGQSDALVKGFARGTGTIFAYLNSDDVYLPGTLNSIAVAFRDEGLDVVYGNTYWIDPEGNTIGDRRQTPFVPLGYLYGGFDLQQPATFWTREIYQKVDGIDSTFSFAFDTELFTRFVKAGGRFHHVNTFLAGFRIHPESKSTTQLERCQSELDRLRKKHLFFPFRSFQASCIRNYARIRRTLCYFLQGDLLWLLKRVPDRIKSRSSDQIVGPRAKSI
jgi:glycosyltransferase involved in cell wall biosynthesis